MVIELVSVYCIGLIIR